MSVQAPNNFTRHILQSCLYPIPHRVKAIEQGELDFIRIGGQFVGSYFRHPILYTRHKTKVHTQFPNRMEEMEQGELDFIRIGCQFVGYQSRALIHRDFGQIRWGDIMQDKYREHILANNRRHENSSVNKTMWLSYQTQDI